jgi:hypothetical protein
VEDLAMRVPPSVDRPVAATGNAAPPSRIGPADGTAPSTRPEGEVRLSARVDEMRRILAIAGSDDDVRVDKIEQARADIAAGRVRLPSALLAEAMLGDWPTR